MNYVSQTTVYCVKHSLYARVFHSRQWSNYNLTNNSLRYGSVIGYSQSKRKLYNNIPKVSDVNRDRNFKNTFVNVA